jgi:hypothetical protein
MERLIENVCMQESSWYYGKVGKNCFSHKAKRAVYNAVLLPNLLHGSESWVCLEKHRSKLNAFFL